MSPTTNADQLDNYVGRIIGSTSAKLRKFLYELAEGTRDYRSLHNLTEQVEHQYHGRFAIELIQNAHDALWPVEGSHISARIVLAIRNDGPHGALYVANDGRPFSHSNFESLSQLGNSDKTPQESIGNKGIGFRSVLEISAEPSIYSRHQPNSTTFDGYCFKFSPSIIRKLQEPILALVRGTDNAPSLWGNQPLVDWDSRLLDKFRSSVERQSKFAGLTPPEWIEKELSFLSPYLLPFSEEISPSETVFEFEQAGFSTLIRLPFKNNAAREIAQKQLQGLDANSTLFLDRVTSLTLDAGDGQPRNYTRRQVRQPDSQYHANEILISTDGESAGARYWVWRNELSIPDSSEVIQSALQQLPGKWSQLGEATVSVGVRVGDSPEHGNLSIFLPTSLGTGCSAHINAPFFGDMSRTLVDFGSEESGDISAASVYNNYLLGEAAKLVLGAIRTNLVGQGIDEARATIDLLAPIGKDDLARRRWHSALSQASETEGIDLHCVPWFLSDHGWAPLNETSLIPELSTPKLLTRDVLRSSATFAALQSGLDSRRMIFTSLSQSYGFNPLPMESDLADTVEVIASSLHGQPRADWNGFWTDIDALFNGDCKALTGKKVLLGNDDQLHANGAECAVFFVPRQGTSDDEEVENEGEVKEIPAALRSFVAFLSDRIHVYEERNETRIRQLLLRSKLVSRFRREDIFNSVLLPKTPTLPVPLLGPHTEVCRDILQWGIQLLALLVDRGKGDRLFKLLQRLPVPCQGGWYPMAQAAFGPEWPNTNGDVADKYLKLARSIHCALAKDKLLLPPSDPRWGLSPLPHRHLLQQAGVFDGLRLLAVEIEAPSNRFEGNRGNFLLPETPPPDYLQEDWEAFRQAVKNQAKPTYYSGRYEIFGLQILPGLDRYHEFDTETRLAFMNAVLASAGNWDDGWETISIRRVLGANDNFNMPSPAAWKLGSVEWLGIPEDDDLHWYRPMDRWHVPSQASAGRRHHFSHLCPLPGDLTHRLDSSVRLSTVMRQLGMPRFDPDMKGPSTQLLVALSDAVARRDVPNSDVFIGQIRAAWGAFEPIANNVSFPDRVLVQEANHKLVVRTPTPDAPVYLPDSGKFLDVLRHFGLPLVVVETRDAQRLASSFDAAFPGSVVRASNLEPRPLSGKQPWEPATSKSLREQEQFSWLIPVLLTVAAFYGGQARRTESKSFQKLVQTLRDASIDIVPELKISLVKGSDSVGEPQKASAVWHGAVQTLLLSNEAVAEFSLMSDALANLLDRDDLEVPVKLVLRELGSMPEYDEIVRALSQLKVSEAQYREVIEHWRGDVRQLIERLELLLSVLRPDADLGQLIECRSDDQVLNFLQDVPGSYINPSMVVQWAREASDVYDFGLKAYRHFGSAVDLSRWNHVLEQRGLAILNNQEAREEFRTHLNASLPVLRSLIVKLLARRPELGTLTQLSEQLSAKVCPESFTVTLWQVEFCDVMDQTVPYFDSWGASDTELDAVRLAKTDDELRDRLISAGVQCRLDPLQIGHDNRSRLQQALARLQRIGLAWAIENKMPNPEGWESRANGFLAELSDQIETAGYEASWDSDKMWCVIQSIFPVDSESRFWGGVMQSDGFDALLTHLGLSVGALENANSRLEALRDEARRRNRLIPVCGREFDSTEDNLNALWQHICDAMPSHILNQLSPIDLKKLLDLNPVSKTTKRRRDTDDPKKRQPPKRLSKSMENLIGLSGEIHAYRVLQQQYGSTAVSPSSWISSNSAVAGVNAPNETDDGRGCDFVIPLKDCTYFIEVKSSEGDQENFTLGSSEIRLAMDLAKKSRKRRKESFMVLRIMNALSEPSFQLLPNPYDPRYQSSFVIEEAETRVRYHAGTRMITQGEQLDS